MPPDDGELQLDPNELQREIERLRSDLELERRRAQESEYRADNLDHQVSQSSQRIHSAQLAQLTAQENAATDAVNATAQEIAGLKTHLATLQAEGKFEEAADVQEKIGDAAARRQQAMQAKAYFTQQKTTFQNTPTDPVERFLADNRSTYSNEDMEWIRNNRRYATDQGFRNRVIQAHGEALNQGLRQRSPEYYQFLEDAAYMRPLPSAPGPRGGQQSQTDQGQERGEAPSGYAPNGYSDGGADAEPESQPEFRIRQESEMANPPNYNNSGGEAFGRQATQPQNRAAGNGSLRQAMAGAPSRRSVNQSGRRTIIELTEGERDTALAIAPHMAPPEVLQAGQPGILQWYNELKYSPAAERIRREWTDRR